VMKLLMHQKKVNRKKKIQDLIAAEIKIRSEEICK